MASRTANRRSGPVRPREALRVVLVGGGLGLSLSGTLWLAVVGAWFGPDGRPPTGLANVLDLSASFPPPVTAVVLGYLGLVVGVGATAFGAAARDPAGSPAIPDLDVPELARRRLVLDVCLSALAAAGAVAATAVVPTLFGGPEPLVAAFLLRLVLLAECGVVLARLWTPLAAHSALLESLEARYDRSHDPLEGLPRRRPALARGVRRLAVAGVAAGVLAVGGAWVLPVGTPDPVAPLVALVGLGVPACGVAGVLPTADTPSVDADLRAQRTLVVVGSVLASAGVAATAGLYVVLAGSSGLTVAYLSPLPTTPADALVGGWTLLFLGYVWRFRDAARAWLRGLGDG